MKTMCYRDMIQICLLYTSKGQHVMGRGRSEKQKQKLLYMAQLLYERTDEDHPVTTQEVIDYLEADGIRSERKTVYTLSLIHI